MELSNKWRLDRTQRLIDVALSLIGLLVLAPLIAFIALLVRVKLGSPVLFSQRRTGLKGRLITLWKFRTMTDARDGLGRLLPDTDRMTSFGTLLRKYSGDELPQLWNVLRGELSLVGPRPLLPQYLERYSPEQAQRHSVTPGITGWAQINGRNAISWEEKFRLDVWYVKHRSLSLNFKILFLTIAKVFAKKDISASGDATMPEFMGQPSDA